MAERVVLQVPVGDGSDDVVEVEVSRSELSGLAESGVVLASQSGDRFRAAGFTLVDAMNRVLPALRAVLLRLREGVHAPDELTMKIGLQVGGETGFVLAKGTTEANIEVCMTWRRTAES